MRILTNGNDNYLVAEVSHYNGKYVLYLYNEYEKDGFISRPLFGSFRFLLSEGRKSAKKLAFYNSLLTKELMESLKSFYHSDNADGLKKIIFNHFK